MNLVFNDSFYGYLPNTYTDLIREEHRYRTVFKNFGKVCQQFKKVNILRSRWFKKKSQ